MGRASREKRWRRENASADQALLKRFVAGHGGKPVVLPVTSTGLPPVSERLIALVEEEMELAHSTEERAKWASIAVLAWNMSLVPDGLEKARQDTEILQQEPMVVEILRLLIDRKQAMFPDDQRIVVDHQLKETPNGSRLSVVSSVPREFVRDGDLPKPPEDR